MSASGILKGQEGITLIEAMVAIVILTIGIFAAMTMQINAVGGSSTALNRTDANNVAMSLLETLKALPFDNGNLTETEPQPNDLVRDADDNTFTAATFPEMQALIAVPPGSAAGTIIDQSNIVYQLSWDVQDWNFFAYTLHKVIRVHMTWNSPLGQNNLEMTTVKYRNISLGP